MYYSHLPEGAYFVTSKEYKGLSQIERYRPACNRIIDFVKKQMNKLN